MLPCTNPCGKSYSSNNTFCLSLDVFADNSIYEIYVNGVPQSSRLGNIIPVKPDPLHAVGMSNAGMISFALCNNWKAGSNTLVIEVASSAPVTGFLAQASTVYRQALSNVVNAAICQGASYVFGNQTLTQTGVSYQTFQTAGGCDSTVALSLQVKPGISTTVQRSICKGQSFLGYTTSGVYVNRFTAINGCDSVRTLRLKVQETPRPNLPLTASLCKGDSLLLSPGEYRSYQWQDSSTQKQFIVRTPGVYRVRVSDSCGVAEASTTVVENECDVYFPSAFTPNNDGRNDIFKVLSNDRLEDYTLSVYNRWGQKIFESGAQSMGWNGTWHGMPQGTEVFAWTCSYKRKGIITEARGTVMLVR